MLTHDFFRGIVELIPNLVVDSFINFALLNYTRLSP